MAGGASGPDEPIVGINVTPLVDVVLVLLIILMVTASSIVSQAVPVDLPSASTARATDEPTTLEIAIDAGGGLFVDERRTTVASLEALARTAVTRDPRTQAVLAADGRASHAHVLDALDTLRSAGVTRVAFRARREATEPGR